MNKRIKIDLEICAITSNYLGVELLIDKQTYFKGCPISDNISIEFEYNVTDIIAHTFEIVITNKRHIIDTVDDVNAAVEIKKINFEGVDMLPAISRQGKYFHNFNGFDKDTVEEFTSYLSIDGVLTFNFYTPLSYWVAVNYPY